MTEEALTPYNLKKGEIYFLDSEKTTSKWYITNNSENGELRKTGFSINVNPGYNNESCYHQDNCQFYMSGTQHAYTNFDNPRFRVLTDNERRWFRHCYLTQKFVPFDKVNAAYPLILRDFPTAGVCWYPTEELLKYLQGRSTTNGSSKSLHIGEVYNKGLAWNKFNIWTVSERSGQPEYDIKQLQPFLNIAHRIMDYPLTPEECYFPEKWCIDVTEANEVLIRKFLQEKKDEYKRYNVSWNPSAGDRFFYPQHSGGAYGITGQYNRPGYRLITTEQFIDNVLTNKQQLIKNKEDGRSSNKRCLKVQGPNLSIRDTAPIRAIGLRCSESQIKIGSGYLPD